MQKRRFIALTLAFALVLSMFVGLSTAPVSAASTKYEVPSKVVHYSNEAEDDLESVDKAVWKKAGSEKSLINNRIPLWKINISFAFSYSLKATSE